MKKVEPYDSVVSKVDALIKVQRANAVIFVKRSNMLHDVRLRVGRTLTNCLGLPSNTPVSSAAEDHDPADVRQDYIIAEGVAWLTVSVKSNKHNQPIALAVILRRRTENVETDVAKVVLAIFQEPEEDAKNDKLFEQFLPDFQEVMAKALELYPNEFMAARTAAQTKEKPK